MTFSASTRAYFPTSSSSHLSRVYSSRSGRKHERFVLAYPKGRGRSNYKLIVSSVFGNINSSVNDNGTAESTRNLLQKLFSQTQKLEERINQDSPLTDDIQEGFNLENLESDLRAALVVLKKKEEDLHDAERKVLLERSELERAKVDLECQEKEIAVIAYKQEQLEDALKDANLNLAFKTSQLEDLKLQLKDRDHYIADLKSALDLKKCELERMRNELVAENEELTRKSVELATKARLLDEANEVIKKQNIEIEELHKMVQMKQQELEVLLEEHLRDEENLKIAENNLKNRTMEYLIACEEIKKAAEGTSKSFEETGKTMAEFGRVKELLADVRSELVATQKSLSLSMKQMKSQELLLEGQIAEFEEQKAAISSYFRSLNDAHVEVESERVQFRIAVAQNKKLENELLIKETVMEKMKDELKKEKLRLEQALQDKSILKDNLDRQYKELGDTRSNLQLKDSELLNAKQEYERLQSQQSLLNQILNEKEAELQSTGKRLEEMSKQIVDLKMLVSSKEGQLIQTLNILKEKDLDLQVTRDELDDTKLKYVDAENAVQRIVDLTNELVLLTKNETEVESLKRSSDTLSSETKLDREHLEVDVALGKENMRTRELEVLASQRALAIKEKELNLVREKLDARERELNTAMEEIAQETEELKKLHTLAQERVGEKTIGDLAIEKLQIEALQLEAEAAASALSKLTELSRDLLNTSTGFHEAEFSTITLAGNELEPARTSINASSDCSNSNGCTPDKAVDLTVVKTEITRLMTMTEELLHEAGI